MKNLLKIATLLIMPLCMVGCSEDNEEIEVKTIEVNYVSLHGDWMLNEWNGAPLADSTYMYISFERTDHTFTIYQNFDSMYGRKISGKFELKKDYYKGMVISGSYDFENGDWNNDYIITDMLESGSMIWSADRKESDVSQYIRCDSIPQSIIDEATHPEI
ncbi:MAG: lipocalin family protein [Marinifilaceae bacterium]|nr:lipocalin family protein [Marinifilaceae bacterium]